MHNDKLEYLKNADPRLARIINYFGPLDIICPDTDSFYFLVREIVGQMISAKAKKVIFSRLLKLCDFSLTPTSISQLSIDDLRRIGLSNSKANFIKNLANLVLTNQIDFNKLRDLSDDDVLHHLKLIKGVGNWTAKMYLLFYLQRNDVLPYEDMAFLQAYKWLFDKSETNKDMIIKDCSPWKPYSSLASRYLYIALDSGLTKTPINDFLKYGKNRT